MEQEFNSLDNQREASEAYIKSQAYEGWRLTRDRYDDGGNGSRISFSGDPEDYTDVEESPEIVISLVVDEKNANQT